MRKLWAVVLLSVLILAAALPSGSLFAANTNVNVKVCYPVPVLPPTITNPEDGFVTEDSSVLLVGEATPGVPVYIFRGDVEVGYVSAGGDGQYVSSVGLTVGNNTLKTSVRDDCGDDFFSDPITVVREAVEPPPEPDPTEEPEVDEPAIPDSDESESQIPAELELNEKQPDVKKPTVKKPLAPGSRPIILEPKNGDHFTDPDIIVTGRATANTEVRLYRNGKIIARVVSDEKGVFVGSVTLQMIDNDLMAIIGTGKNVRKSEIVSVTYEKEKKLAGFIPNWIIPAAATTTVAAAGIAALYVFVFQPSYYPNPVRKLLKLLRLIK